LESESERVGLLSDTSLTARRSADDDDEDDEYVKIAGAMVLTQTLLLVLQIVGLGLLWSRFNILWCVAFLLTNKHCACVWRLGGARGTLRE
jgi:hypothetical protein